jgi:hypothetical protein
MRRILSLYIVLYALFFVQSYAFGAELTPEQVKVCAEKIAAKNVLTPQARRELKNTPQSVSVTRYNKENRMWAGFRMLWNKVGDYLAPSPRHQKVSTDSESPLSKQQEFPLKKMVETGYLTPEQGVLYAGLIKLLDHAQFTFFETTHRVSEFWIRQNFKIYPQERIDDVFYDDDSHLRSLRTASLWSVSGQTLDPIKKLIRSNTLPWQLEPKFKEISEKNFDRNKYKYVWEWGRGAQDLAGENEELRRVATATAYRELISLGGNLDEAFVIFHSLDKTNTDLYLKLHPDSVFPKGYDDPNDTLFLVPLSEMLEKYAPSELSAQLNALKKIFKEKLSEIQIIELHAAIQEIFWQELNFKFEGTEQETPILFADYSRGKEQVMSRLLKHFGLKETAGDVMMSYYQFFRATYFSEDMGQYKDPSDPPVLYHLLGPRDVVEASNLDPKLLEKDSRYPMEVLFSLFIYYAHKIALPVKSRADIDHAVAQIHGENVQFAISTYSPQLSASLKKLNPKEVLSFKGETEPGLVLSPRPLRSNAKPWIEAIFERPIYSHIFDSSQIIKMMQQNPEEFKKAWGALYNGSWQGQWGSRILDQF